MVITRKITVRDISNFVYCPLKAYISMRTEIQQIKTKQMIAGEILHKAFFIKVKHGIATLEREIQSLLNNAPRQMHNSLLRKIKSLTKSKIKIKLPHALIEPTLTSIVHQVTGKPDIVGFAKKPIIIEVKFPTNPIQEPTNSDVVQIIWYYILFSEVYNYQGPVSLLIVYPLQNKLFPIKLTQHAIKYALSVKEKLIATITDMAPLPKVRSRKCNYCEFKTFCHMVIRP